MNILVIGSNGQLGTDLVRVFRDAGHAVSGTDVPEIDITSLALTASVVRACNPQVIVNTAAFTAVDEAESKPDAAYRINRDGAGVVATVARETGATLVHISTDYVFCGDKAGPYVETDMPAPCSVYGKSKLEGEQRVAAECARHFIWRIAWLYGAHGQNFVKNIVRIARRNSAVGKPLSVVDDQYGCPTHTVDVGRQLLAVIDRKEYGVYHGVSNGSCTWYEFAAYVIRKYGIRCEVRPCTTAEFPRPAPRPANSVLANARLKALGCDVMPEWQAAFDAFFSTNPNLD
jgi:dTDP-4-dehydrorhamnose reductase